MKPTIQDEDLVFVDMGQRTIDAQGIYVIDVYSRLLLKKALILSDGTLVLRSDNIVDYPDEERIDLRKASECINIAGKVLAWWTMKH
jgi:phage repressor protein C with HTH and peptisase S24 domain